MFDKQNTTFAHPYKEMFIFVKGFKREGANKSNELFRACELSV